MVVLSLSHPCVNHTTEATKFWYRGGRHCTAIPVVERLCGACLHRVAVWAEALDNPCLAPSHRWVVCTIATNVAQRELLRVTEPAQLFRRGGRCGLQCVARITGTHNPCRLPDSQLWPISLQLMKYHQYHQS
jgi:hypothetical protein